MKLISHRMRYLPTFIIIAFGFISIGGCGPQAVDNSHLNERDALQKQLDILRTPPKNFAWWNYQVLFGISQLKEYAAGLKGMLEQIENGGFRLAPEDGFSLLANKTSSFALTGKSSLDPAQIQAFAQYWQMYGQAMESAANSNRIFTEARGSAMMNHMNAIGKAVENEGKAIDNIEKALSLQLTRAYIDAYSAYTETYATYSKFIGNVYQKMEKNAQVAISAAVKDLGSYQKQANICMARASRLWENDVRAANFENQLSKIHWNTLTRKFNWYSSQPHGEECLNRVLLSSHSDADKLLYNLELHMNPVNGKKMKMNCPTIDQAHEFASTEIDATDFDLMEYPPLVKEKITTEDLNGNEIEVNAITGVYWPVTYYQLYRVLTNGSPDLRVQIGSPPDVEAQACHIVNRNGVTISRPESKEQLEYVKRSRQFERFDVLQALNGEDETYYGDAVDFTPVDRQSEDISIARGNEAYTALIMRLNGIFESVDGCRQHFVHRKRIAADVIEANLPDAPANAPAAVPNEKLVEGRSISSILTTFNDPDFPEMSNSIRSCMALAEQHRYNAMAKIDIVKAVHEVLEKMGQTPPPKMPAPPFKPIEARVNTVAGSVQ